MNKIYLSDKDNILFQDMDSYEITSYLSSLKDYLIEYRDKLNFNDNTFGIEIEYEGLDYINLLDEISYYTGWKSVEEKGFEVGGELVSPVLIDNPINWKEIKDVLTLIDNKEGTYAHGGAHVHVGAQSLKDYDSLIKFLLLYTSYEDVLYRFGYMDRLNPRKTMINASSPLSIDLANDMDEIMSKHSIRSINHRYERFFGVNFLNLSSLKNKKEKNTIEFRFGNGTFNPVLWQNYVNTCVKLLEASHKDLDIEKLLYVVYLIKETRMNYSGFGRLDINRAMEFCDIIFDNALDKTNFMKQFIKDGRDTVDSTQETYSKEFTRGV